MVYDDGRNNTIVQGRMAAADAREPGHSRPAEKFSFWRDINIFGALPNWQGKLFVRRPVGNFFFLVLVLVQAVSRRCCVKDDTECGCSSNSERYRSWSVSIQTVVVVQESLSVLPCPGEGGPPMDEGGDSRKKPSSNGTRLRSIFRHFVLRWVSKSTGHLTL